MEAYESFAKVYDIFMNDTPYEQWCEWIQEQLHAEGIREGLVLDLGCGTGRMTRLLARSGYDMTGVDNSVEMLGLALKEDSNHSILYLNQDMKEFELYGTVRAIVSTCDCINYITEEADLLQVFLLANNYLDPGGLFLFDFNTVYKYAEMMGNCTIAENREEGSFIWENYYDEEEQINEYDLTLFIREESGLYHKYEENHYQRAYSLEQIKRLLAQSGLEFVAACDDYTGNIATDVSERICVIAREVQK